MSFSLVLIFTVLMVCVVFWGWLYTCLLVVGCCGNLCTLASWLGLFWVIVGLAGRLTWLDCFGLDRWFIW